MALLLCWQQPFIIANTLLGGTHTQWEESALRKVTLTGEAGAMGPGLDDRRSYAGAQALHPAAVVQMTSWRQGRSGLSDWQW